VAVSESDSDRGGLAHSSVTYKKYGAMGLSNNLLKIIYMMVGFKGEMDPGVIFVNLDFICNWESRTRSGLVLLATKRAQLCLFSLIFGSFS
jgi:hypothetical protein